MTKLLGWFLLSLPLPLTAFGATANELVSQDLFVDHVSTVPANAGQKVGIFVRQKVMAIKKGVKNVSRGEFQVDENGSYKPLPATKQ